MSGRESGGAGAATAPAASITIMPQANNRFMNANPLKTRNRHGRTLSYRHFACPTPVPQLARPKSLERISRSQSEQGFTMPGRANPVAFTLRLLFGTSRADTLTTSPGGWRMGRRILLFAIAALIIGGISYAAFVYLNKPNVEHVEPPPPPKIEGELPTPAEFEHLARTDPVAMYKACLVRYERDGIQGATATLEKQERVHGKLNDREVVKLMCAGEVPDKTGNSPDLRVRMIWESGHRSAFTVKNLASLYAAGQNNDQMKVLTSLTTLSLNPKDGMARTASRYCITDGGIYRGMLRTYTAWKKRQEAGELNATFMGIESPPQVGGRLCYVIQRRCPKPEVDPFALDESPDHKADPQRDGTVEVTVYIDIERWLSLGTMLKRADGSVLGEYWFRDVKLSKESFQPDPFTMESIKAAIKK
jgi:hypothetical protein